MNPMLSGPLVYVLVELSDREIPSRLVLAAKLRQAGFRVVLAQQWAIMQSLPTLPRGILFYKGYNKIFRESMRLAKKLGFVVVAQEEEVFGRVEGEIFSQYSGKDLSDCVDAIFCNNEFELNFLQKFVDDRKLVLSGNPRSEIMFGNAVKVLERRRSLIRQEFGRYVLINTNFGWTNSIWGSFDAVKSAFIQAGAQTYADVHGDQYYSDITSFEDINYEIIFSFIKLIHKDVRVVVRPHPSERLDKWHKLTKPFGRAVRVIRSGTHLPWTMEAGLVVHTSCTTGIEAAALGIPQVSTWLGESNLYQRQLAVGIIGVPAATAEGLASRWNAVESCREGVVNAEDFKSRFVVPDGVAVCDSMIKHLREISHSFCSTVSEPMPHVWPKPVPQLLKKCNIYRSEVESCVTTQYLDSTPLPSHLGRSIFEFGEDNSPPLGVKELIEEAQEKVLRYDFWGVVDLFARYSHILMRSEGGILLVCRSFIELYMWPECVQTCDHFISVNSSLPKAIALSKIHALWRMGERDRALELCGFIYSRYDSQSAYLWLRKAGVAGKSFTILGDSHSRYFRYLQNNRESYFRKPVRFEIFECGGATAFGLSNEDSRSGARRVFDSKEFLTSAARTDFLIIWFGEVDCRRGVWRAMEDLGVAEEQALAKSILSISKLVSEAVGRGFKVVVLGVKSPNIADPEFRSCCEVDRRCVFKTVGERESLTASFNASLALVARECEAIYVPFVDSGLGDPSARWFLRDDTHGDIAHYALCTLKSLVVANLLGDSELTL